MFSLGISVAQWVRSIFDVSGCMVYTAVAASGGTILKGTTKWKEVKTLSGHLPGVNEAQGKHWKTREKFHSALEDEASYSEKITRSRCGTGSVSTTASPVSPPPRIDTPDIFPACSIAQVTLQDARGRTLPQPGSRNKLQSRRQGRMIEQLALHFDATFPDRDKRICPADFALLLRRAFPEISREEIDQEFAMADCNCNCFFEFKEFVQWLRPEEADAASHKPLLATQISPGRGGPILGMQILSAEKSVHRLHRILRKPAAAMGIHTILVENNHPEQYLEALEKLQGLVNLQLTDFLKWGYPKMDGSAPEPCMRHAWNEEIGTGTVLPAGEVKQREITRRS
eukprot:s4151_g4.t1